MTFIEMVQKKLPDIEPRSKNFLDKIEHSSTRMLSLIRDILSYSQLANIKQEPVRIDLNDVLKSIMSDFELLIEDKQATITSDKLPVIHGIRIQISQMFANLISNGLKFSRRDRKCLIAISCEKLSMSETKEFRDLNDEWPYFRITFSDNGIGFSQQNARQIFDIFQRLHGKSEYEGTGIGLAMCKKIAENHHGTIYAEATPGEGATFHVLLPERISN